MVLYICILVYVRTSGVIHLYGVIYIYMVLYMFIWWYIFLILYIYLVLDIYRVIPIFIYGTGYLLVRGVSDKYPQNISLLQTSIKLCTAVGTYSKRHHRTRIRRETLDENLGSTFGDHFPQNTGAIFKRR